MLALSIQLILAHLIGDFLLQPDHWVKQKEIGKHKSKHMYYHIGVHALALIILLQFNLHYWLGMVVILLSHLFFDCLKINLQKPENQIQLFFTDQVAHLLIIAGVVCSYFPESIHDLVINYNKILLFLAALILVSRVSSIILKVILSRWKIIDENPNQAGKYIGLLERLFIFSFLLMNYWEGIGLLLAAKSMFRFGDLNNAKDRNLTEYVLIGTLLSFGLAVLIAKAYLYINELL